MLLFRDEEHVGAWLARHHHARGWPMTLATLWQVARIWYEGRLDPQPLTRTVDDKQAILEGAGLTGRFWRLPR